MRPTSLADAASAALATRKAAVSSGFARALCVVIVVLSFFRNHSLKPLRQRQLEHLRLPRPCFTRSRGSGLLAPLAPRSRPHSCHLAAPGSRDRGLHLH